MQTCGVPVHVDLKKKRTLFLNPKRDTDYVMLQCRKPPTRIHLLIRHVSCNFTTAT